MKKNLFIIKYILLLLAIFILFSCAEKDEKDWTILIYMAADNGLYQAAVQEINEMETADFSENINVIVEIDNSEYGIFSEARRYKIQPEKNIDETNITSPVIATLGEIDSGDYHNLTAFANWGFSHYPSRKKALIIWSHGNGWHASNSVQFCPDNESNSYIDAPNGDLKKAFEGMNYHLDLLIFDACLMQELEIISEIYSSADFIIGSEDEIKQTGFPYGSFEKNDILSIWEDFISTRELSLQIANSFYDSYKPGGSQNYEGDIFPISCSVLECSKFSKFLNDFSSFCQEWKNNASDSYFENARQNCYEFNDLQSDIDIKEFFFQLLQEDISDDLSQQTEEILADIDESFISQKSYDYPAETIGTATIWFPVSEEIYMNLKNEYESLNISTTGWSEFLENSFEEN